MHLKVHFDRVGCTYTAGEVITGVVMVETTSSTSAKNMQLEVSGLFEAKTMGRQPPSLFDKLHEEFKPFVLMALTIPLGGGASSLKFPAGTTELPFSFPAAPTHSAALAETYNGVFLTISYTAKASAQLTFQSVASDVKEFWMMCPGQGEKLPLPLMPTSGVVGSDGSFGFTLTDQTVRRSKRAAEAFMPVFHITGLVERCHIDVDTALRGYVRVVKSSAPITSIEIQLSRVESCVSDTRRLKGREVTEVQNIQIGDGDVLRDWDVPVYMMFPRWYTCPACVDIAPQYRVEFEVYLVVTFEGRVQVSQCVPIRLFRASPQHQVADTL